MELTRTYKRKILGYITSSEDFEDFLEFLNEAKTPKENMSTIIEFALSEFIGMAWLEHAIEGAKWLGRTLTCGELESIIGQACKSSFTTTALEALRLRGRSISKSELKTLLLKGLDSEEMELAFSLIDENINEESLLLELLVEIVIKREFEAAFELAEFIKKLSRN